MKIQIIVQEDGRKFTQDEIKFVKLLEEDEEFETIIKNIRDQCKIPLNPTSKVDNDKVDFKAALHAGYWLTKIYGPIPTSWVLTFTEIILSNRAVPPIKDSFKPIEFLTIEELEKHQGFAIGIIIRENLSIRQIKKFLDDNSSKINEELSYLPKLPNINLRDLEIKKRILALKRKGKTDSEIASVLAEEYGDQLPFSPDYEIVGVLRNRFKKDVRKILKKMDTKTLDLFINALSGKLQ